MTPEEQARRAMIEKRFGGNTNGAATGGAGSARRKAKGTPKSVGGNLLFIQFPTDFLQAVCLLAYYYLLPFQLYHNRSPSNTWDRCALFR